MAADKEYRIKGPNEAKKLLGFADDKLTGKRPDKIKVDDLPENSLLKIYLEADPKKKGEKRKYSKFRTLLKMVEQCDEFLDDEKKNIENTIKFLTIIHKIITELKFDKKTTTFKNAIRKFVCLNFCIDELDSEKTIEYILSALISKYDPQNPLISFAQPLANTGAFWLSNKVNDSKADRNQISEHVWLGKLPKKRDEDFFVKNIHSVVSAATLSEYNTSLAATKKSMQFLSPSTYRINDIDFICHDLFIDYEQPFRENGKSLKLYHPKTGKKFESIENWNTFLDELYTDIYFSVRLMIEKVSQDKTVYVHCKAGKGRSVMKLGVFYILFPAELLSWLSAEKQIKLVALLTDVKKNLREIIEIIWDHMVSKRSHIDNNKEIKQAVFDSISFILDNKEKLDKISLQEIKEHFALKHTPAVEKTISEKEEKKEEKKEEVSKSASSLSSSSEEVEKKSLNPEKKEKESERSESASHSRSRKEGRSGAPSLSFWSEKKEAMKEEKKGVKVAKVVEKELKSSESSSSPSSSL
jgi:hypothetical protein